MLHCKQFNLNCVLMTCLFQKMKSLFARWGYKALVISLISLASFSANATSSASVNLAFTPSASVSQGDGSSLDVTVTNTNQSYGLSSVAITFDLASANLTSTETSASVNTCNFTVSKNGTKIILSAGNVAAAADGTHPGQCHFTFPVNSVVSANYPVTIPAGVSSTSPAAGFSAGGTTPGFSATQNGGTVSNDSAANATLSVATLSNLTGAITYSGSTQSSTTTIYSGNSSTMTIALTNPNASKTVPISAYTFTLPTNLVVAASPASSLTCTGGTAGTFTAVAGASSVTLTGGEIGAASKNCTMTVSVTPSADASYNISTSSITSVGNTRGLTTSWTINTLKMASPVSISSSLSSSLLPVSSSTNLTIIVTNLSSAQPLNISNYTTTLSGTGSSVVSSGTVSCTGAGSSNGSLSASGTSIVLTTAVAGLGGSCTITVPVTKSSTGTLTSTGGTSSPSIMTNGVATYNLTIPSATKTASFEGGLVVSKSASDTTTYQGQNFNYTIAIANYSSSTATNVSFKDVLPSSSTSGDPQMGVVTSGTAVSKSSSCSGGTLSPSSANGSSTVTWTGGAIAAASGGTPTICTITINVTLPDMATVGATYNNSIVSTDVYADGLTTDSSQSTLSASNTVTSSVTIAQAYSGGSGCGSGGSSKTICQSETATLTLTIANPTAANITGATFNGTMPTSVFVAATPAFSTTCTGSPVFTPGSDKTTFSVSGLTVPFSGSGSCTVSFKVTSSVVGSYNQPVVLSRGISDNELLVNSANSCSKSGTSTCSSSGTLTVSSPLSGSVSFSPTSVAQNGISRISLTLTNNAAFAITNLSFTNIFPTGTSAFVMAPTPSASNTCGGTPVFSGSPGATGISFSGANLSAGASCVLSFNIKATGSSPSSSRYTFSLPANAISTNQGATNASISGNLSFISSTAITPNISFTPNTIAGTGNASVMQIDIRSPTSYITRISCATYGSARNACEAVQ